MIPFVPLLHLALLPSLNSPPPPRGPRQRRLVVASIVSGLLVNAWEYSTEWQAWEKSTFGAGGIDYGKSVFDVRFVTALHGFAGWTTFSRSLQFFAVAGATTWLALRSLRIGPSNAPKGQPLG